MRKSALECHDTIFPPVSFIIREDQVSDMRYAGEAPSLILIISVSTCPNILYLFWAKGMFHHLTFLNNQESSYLSRERQTISSDLFEGVK